MSLLDLKRTFKNDNEMRNQTLPGAEESEYPPGMKLHLDTEDIHKIESIQSLDVGATVDITARGSVISKDEHSKKDGSKDRSMVIQIEMISVNEDKPMDKWSTKEFMQKRNKRK